MSSTTLINFLVPKDNPPFLPMFSKLISKGFKCSEYEGFSNIHFKRSLEERNFFPRPPLPFVAGAYT